MPTKQPKANTYRTLYRLNRAFDFITEQLQATGRAGLLSRKMLQTFLAFNQELQSDINQTVLNTLETREAADWDKFGKVRNRIEKEINKVR